MLPDEVIKVMITNGILSQIDIHHISLLNTSLHTTIERNYFENDNIRKLDKHTYRLQPGNITIDACLIPLILHGIINIEKVYRYYTDKNLSQLNFLKRRISLCTYFDILPVEADAEVKDLLDLRAHRILERAFSCGSIWAMALKICQWSKVLKPTISENFVYLFGMGEQTADSDESDFLNAKSFKEIPIGSSFAGVPSRNLFEQWEICHWLWKGTVFERNRNVSKLLKFCWKKTSQLSSRMIRLLIDSKYARDALLKSLVLFKDIGVLYDTCGIGHLDHVFTKAGVEALSNSKFTLNDLVQIPKHNMVRALCMYPSVFQYQDMIHMTATVEDRARMVDLLVREYTTSWLQIHFSISQLLQLPSYVCLEFVCSKNGRFLLQEWDPTITLHQIGASFEALQEKTPPRILRNSSTSRQLFQVLHTYLHSDSGHLLHTSGLLTFAHVVQYVQSVDVIHVLLSPAGIQAFENGLLKANDVDSITESSQLLRIIGHNKPIQLGEDMAHDPMSGFRHPKYEDDDDDENGLEHNEIVGEEQDIDDGEPCKPHTVLDAAGVPFMNTCRRLKVIDFKDQVDDGICTDEVARRHLENNLWDMDAAISEYEEQHSESVRESMITQYCNETHASENEAKQQLRKHRWNLETAIDDYHANSTSSKHPRSTWRPTSKSLPYSKKIRRLMHMEDEELPTITDPSLEQLQILTKLLEVVNNLSEEDAVALLIMCDWKLEDAVSTYLASSDGK